MSRIQCSLCNKKFYYNKLSNSYRDKMWKKYSVHICRSCGTELVYEKIRELVREKKNERRKKNIA